MIAWLKGLFGAISSSISSPSPPPDEIPPSPTTTTTNGPLFTTPKKSYSLSEEKYTSYDPEITQNILRELISIASHELEALEKGKAADIRTVSMVAMRLKPCPPSIPPRIRSNNTLSGTSKREESVMSLVTPPAEGDSVQKKETDQTTGSTEDGKHMKPSFGKKGVILPPPQPIKSIGGMTWNPGMSKWEPTSKSAKARNQRLTASLTPVQKWEEIKNQHKQMSKKNKHKMSTITALTQSPMAEEKNGMRLNPYTMIWEKIDGDEPDPFEGIGWKADEMKQVRDSWNDVRKEFTITSQLRNLWNKSHEKHKNLGGWLTKETDDDNRSFLDNARRLAIKKLISDTAYTNYTPYSETPPIYDSSPRGLDFTVVTPRSGIPRRLRLSGVLQKDVSGYVRQDGVDLGRFATIPGQHLRQESAGAGLGSPKGYRSPRGYSSPRQQLSSPRHLREYSDPGYRITSPTGFSRQENGDVRLKDLASRINIRKKSRVSLSGLDSPRSYSPRRHEKSVSNVDSPHSIVIDSAYSSDREDWTDDFAPTDQPLRLAHQRLQLWMDTDDEESDFDDLTGGELHLRQEFQSPKTKKEKVRNSDIIDDFSDIESPRILVSEPNIKTPGDEFLSKWAESDSEEEVAPPPQTQTPPSTKISGKFKPREDLAKWMESDDDHFDLDFDRRKDLNDGSPTLRPKVLLKWDSDTEDETVATEERTTRYNRTNPMSPVKLDKKDKISKKKKDKKFKKKSNGDISTWAESDSDSDYGENFTEDLALKLTTNIHENQNNEIPTESTPTKTKIIISSSERENEVPLIPTVPPEIPPPVEFNSSRNIPSSGVFDGRNTQSGGIKRALVTVNPRKSNNHPTRLLKKDKFISRWAEIDSDSDYDVDFGEQLSNTISLTPKKLDSENRFERDDDEDSDYETDFGGGGDISQKIAAFTERKKTAAATMSVVQDGNTRSGSQGEMSEENLFSPIIPHNTLPSSPISPNSSSLIPKTPKKPALVVPDTLRNWVENSDSDSEDIESPTGEK